MTSTAGPSTGPSTEDAAEHEAAEHEAALRRRRGLRRSATDMLWSVLVVVGIVMVIVALVPRPNARPIEHVDVGGAAQRAASAVGFTPAVPQLPAGWVVTSAGVRNSADGVVTWHVGYLTPDGHNASIEQAAHVDDQWESIMDSGGTPLPAVEVDGTTWQQRYKDVREVTALIHRTGGRETMITSKGGGLPNAEVLARGVPVSQR